MTWLYTHKSYQFSDRFFLLSSPSTMGLSLSWLWRWPSYISRKISFREVPRKTDETERLFEAILVHHPLCRPEAASVLGVWIRFNTLLDMLSEHSLKLRLRRWVWFISRHIMNLGFDPHMSHDFTDSFFDVSHVATESFHIIVFVITCTSNDEFNDVQTAGKGEYILSSWNYWRQ